MVDDAVLVRLQHVRCHVQGGRLRDRRGIKAAVAGRDAAFREDGRHHRQVVLVAHEVVARRVAGLVQRI